MQQSRVDPSDVGGRIGVSLSTNRSHLRNIYAKAQVPGQVGLMRRLLHDAGPPEGLTLRPPPRAGAPGDRQLRA